MSELDDLEQLWQTQPVQTDVKGEDMRKIIMQRMAKFDRTIRNRNRREIIASLVGAIAFSGIAVGQTSWISRVGSILVLLTFAWIIYYLLRHGSGPADPNPDQSAAAYRSSLIAKIDHQIQLLRTAKYWYLLPMYAGLLLLTSGGLIAHAAAGTVSWRDAVGPAIYTVVFAVVWWANDVYAVKQLRHWRAQLESGGQPGGFRC